MKKSAYVILQCNLTPDDLPRKTYRELEKEVKYQRYFKRYPIKFSIGRQGYHAIIMNSDCDEKHQLCANEGDIVVSTYMTVMFPGNIEWDTLVERKNELEAWATEICPKLKCSFKIVIGATYK